MRLSPLNPNQDKVLYEQVADRLQEMIANGTLKPGDRLPSIRKLKQQLSVSFSTVMEAYRVLEDRGLIAARPQSGYYVKPTALQHHLEPSLTEPYARVCTIDTSLAFEFFNHILDADVVQLATATPAAEHLPIAQLNRLMAKEIREHPEAAHSYNVPSGWDGLRAALSKRMLDAGCSIHPDHIVITNGALEGIYLSLQAITQPGDTVAIASPTYFALLETMKALKLKACALPTHAREGISLSHLEAALAAGDVQACLLVSNFSHPLGTCMEDSTKKQLVELINRYQVSLIEDDVYGDLYFEGTRPKAIKAFDTENRVIYCSSVSKTLSPGLRVGWCSGGCHHLKVVHQKSITNRTSAMAHSLRSRRFYPTEATIAICATCDAFIKPK